MSTNNIQNPEYLIKNVIPMLSPQEVIDLETFIKSLDENLDKKEGKQLIIGFINNIINRKLEEEGQKIIKYYEEKHNYR